MRFVSVRVVTLLLALAGGVIIVTAVHPRAGLLRLATLPGVEPLGRMQALLIGTLLIAVARGVAIGRYVGYLLALGVFGLTGAACVPHRPIGVLVGGLCLATLVAARAAFPARPDPARLRLAGQIGLVALVAAAVASGVDAADNRGAPGGAGHAVIQDISSGEPGTWPVMLLTVAITGTLLAAVLVALASASRPAPGGRAERAAVAALVAHPDADSLAPFATRADRSYVWSPDRRAVIGYRVVLGTALAGGDPVGERDSVPGAVGAFMALCAARGWRPAVLGASAATLPEWRRYGLRAVRVGDEAVLPVATFSLASRQMRNVRQAVARTRNAGVTVTVAPLTAAHAARLAPVLAGWLGGSRERGFSMNLDAILTPRPGCLVATAYAADGVPVAFARFAVCAAGSVYTLDVAPRVRHAPGGVIERLVVEVVGHARRDGVREVSLNFAALRGVSGGGGPGARLGSVLLRLLDPWVEVAPLNRFCAKFQPCWRPRSLLVPSWWELPEVAVAAMHAELGRSRAGRYTAGAATDPAAGGDPAHGRP